MEGRWELAINQIWVRFKHPNRVFLHPVGGWRRRGRLCSAFSENHPLWGYERSGNSRFISSSGHLSRYGRRSEWISEGEIR